MVKLASIPAMKRRLTTKKIFAATIGIGAVSYVIACSTGSTTSGIPMPPPPSDAQADVGITSGNLMPPPPPDAQADVGVTSGNLMPPIDSGTADGSKDASDDGG